MLGELLMRILKFARAAATPIVGIAITATVSLLAASGAYAYFVGGHGSGSGMATSASPAEIKVTGSTSAGLYPGGKGSLVVTVKNPYPSMALSITGISAGTDVISVTGGNGCTVSNSGVSLDTADANASSSTVAAGASSTITFSNAVQMDAITNNSGCQGATFTVPFLVNVKVG